MVWIKICGITNEMDALETSVLGADALGFILSTDSPRRISCSRAADIIKKVRNFKISRVGVFVNEDVNAVYDAYLNLGLDYVQLSGDESCAYMKELKNLDENMKIIAAVKAGGNRMDLLEDLKERARDIEKLADYMLMDNSGTDDSGKILYGGTGKTFNWELAKKIEPEKPIILSGGLDHKNILKAVRKIKPFGVDASSRLESCPGKKDLNLVELFIKRLRDNT